MNALDTAIETVREAFSEYGEDARYISASGVVTEVKVMRFDPYQQDELSGQGFSTSSPSAWVMLEQLPSPQNGGVIETSDGRFEVIEVQPKSRRGYAKLMLSNL